MLKSRKNGYDGKGNFVMRSEADLETGFRELKGDMQKLMVEEFIDFEMEISVIATRGIDGEKVVYPVAYNVHEHSILDTTIVPVPLPNELKKTIQDVAEKVTDIFDGVGTFCVEMFVGRDNMIYVNEVAPRPHNSGHYTIEGCRVNQFENHIRAIIGLSLGDTSRRYNAIIMRNLLGRGDGSTVVFGVEEAYKQPGVNVHIYGKKESQKWRKMGHYIVTADSMEQA
ncbi:MAG: ATP-grasp domain-containing protein [Methanosarcinales archaeon]|jgi:5-(carboxyamino)imidazole ribonucleotide synthase|nr:ATP-grasp domain-containing protein [Methanosarcinales archaeon]